LGGSFPIAPINGEEFGPYYYSTEAVAWLKKKNRRYVFKGPEVPKSLEVSAITEFGTVAPNYSFSTVTLNNGNIFLAYKDSTASNVGKFTILTPELTEVVAPTVFETGIISSVSCTLTKNGNVFIAYEDSGNSGYGTFCIYNSAGTQVVTPTVFNSGYTTSIFMEPFDNENVLILYSIANGENYYYIYSQTGTQVLGSTFFATLAGKISRLP